MLSNLKLFISIFIIFTLSAFANQKEFKVSFDPDYAPFSYINNNEPEGLLIDYWKLWAEKNDYKVKFVNGKLWENAINLAKKGSVDFFLGTTPYEDWMLSSNSIYRTQTSIFMHKGSSRSFNKKASYIIGIIGSDYEEHMKKSFPNSEIIIYQDYVSIFKDFKSKKIDLIYEDKIAIEFYTLRHDIFHLIHAIDFVSEYPKVHAISKNEKLIDIFNKGFEKLDFNDLYNIETKWIIDKKSRFYEHIKTLHLTKEEKEFIKNKQFKVSISKNWKPFTFISKNEPSGISSDIWKLIVKKANLNSENIVYDSFTEQLKSIETKNNDLIFSTGMTEDRKEYSIFSDPYVTFPISIVTLKDENFIEDIEYLFDKTIAVGKNFTAHKMLKEKYPYLNLKLVNSIEEGLNSVANKQSYAYIDIKPNLTYNINRLKLDNLKITGNTGLTFDLRVMIRDDYPLLQSIINKTIKTLNEEETDLIVSKWSNIQFQEEFDYTKVWIVIFAVAISFALLIYLNQLNIKRNKILQEKVDERTKELVDLNEHLEQKVELATKELKKVNYILDEAQKIAKLGSFQYNIKKKSLVFSDELYKILKLDKEKTKLDFEVALNYVHKEDKEKVKKLLKKAVLSKKNISEEFRMIVDGKTKYIQSTSKITKFDENDNPVLFIGTILDLTKIKLLEKEKIEKETMLAQQSKMAALGEMLENIAHQWRQPLSIISTASTGLQIKFDFEEDVPKELILENIKTINHQAQYLSKTIDDFRNFFNPNKQSSDFNVKKSIENAIYLVESKAKSKDIEIIKDIEDINIFAQENELIQVLINILNNAIDAFDKRSHNFIFVNTHVKNDELLIEIKDNAGGINPSIINRVFEPYFTTKHKSQGTGIGLYMSNEIVTKHLNGSILVSNKSYVYNNISCEGACFEIALATKEEEL